VENTVETCGDWLDNDCDGLVDCADPACSGVVPEACGDTLDNDCDGFADCADGDCGPAGDEDCSDGLDNDCDGQIDCADSDCCGWPPPNACCPNCTPDNPEWPNCCWCP
jgi:hypothetical protein